MDELRIAIHLDDNIVLAWRARGQSFDANFAVERHQEQGDPALFWEKSFWGIVHLLFTFRGLL